MSDDGSCGDGGCFGDTGDCCGDLGEGCADSGTNGDISNCEETVMETVFSEDEDILIDSYQPESSSSKNKTERTEPPEVGGPTILFILLSTLVTIIITLICKLNN